MTANAAHAANAAAVAEAQRASGVHQFEIEDGDGNTHAYLVQLHGVDEGQSIVFALIAVGGEPLGALLQGAAGKLIAEGTLEDLRGMLGERDLLRLSGEFESDAARQALERFEGMELVSVDESSLMLSMQGASRQLPALFGALSEAGMQIGETTLTQPNLESLFIKLTGRELRE